MDLYRMNVWKIVLAGGPVMWPILLCSILAMAIILERFIYLNKIKIDTQDFLARIIDKMKHHQIKEALQLCEGTANPVSNMLKGGILKYDRPRDQVKEALEDASLYEVPKLEKNLSLLATLAHVSPLLGLLGTATGLVRCFQVIQSKAAAAYSVSAADLAGGVWEALLTTVAGLVVAIPAFVAYNYFVSRVNNFVVEMEKAATEFVNFLSE